MAEMWVKCYLEKSNWGTKTLQKGLRQLFLVPGALIYLARP
jgi:hypothetical protein